MSLHMHLGKTVKMTNGVGTVSHSEKGKLLSTQRKGEDSGKKNVKRSERYLTLAYLPDPKIVLQKSITLSYG